MEEQEKAQGNDQPIEPEEEGQKGTGRRQDASTTPNDAEAADSSAEGAGPSGGAST